MDSLKEQHKRIADLIGKRSVAFVDIPYYLNVGDLLIYKGTEAFFTQYNVNVVYRAGCVNVDYKQLEKTDVILMQGGGNFGDLYYNHQKLREDIVSKFVDKRIICLPQSIFFKEDKVLDKSASLFRRHKDYHFCVRDDVSFKIAQKFTDNVLKMPDMAHSIHPMVDAIEVGKSNIIPPRVLNLMRVDKEKKVNIETVNKVGFDWENITTTSDHWMLMLIGFMEKVPYLRNKTVNLWASYSDEIVFRSVDYFSSHTIIHTDRLHGLILSALLGKEIILKDNSYNKNTNYYKEWLIVYPYLELASA
jgi:pyruvyl transferase EpsO